MTQLSWRHNLLRKFHPEAIPWPGSVVYNAISQSQVFQHHYDLVAQDILRQGLPERVLDIGTGPGWLPIRLHQLSPTTHIIGLDLSSAMLLQAQKNLASWPSHIPIQFLKGTANCLPFPNDTFDLVVSTGVAHHWKKPEAAFHEIHRVLKPGRSAFIYDVVRDLPAPVFQQARLEFGTLRTLLFWLHSFEEPFYDSQELESFANAAFQESEFNYLGLLFCLKLSRESKR